MKREENEDEKIEQEIKLKFRCPFCGKKVLYKNINTHCTNNHQNYEYLLFQKLANQIDAHLQIIDRLKTINVQYLEKMKNLKKVKSKKKWYLAYKEKYRDFKNIFSK